MTFADKTITNLRQSYLKYRWKSQILSHYTKNVNLAALTGLYNRFVMELVVLTNATYLEAIRSQEYRTYYPQDPSIPHPRYDLAMSHNCEIPSQFLCICIYKKDLYEGY